MANLDNRFAKNNYKPLKTKEKKMQMVDGDVVPLVCNVKCLGRQTPLTAPIDPKGVSGAVANRPPPDDPPARKKRSPRSAATEQGRNRKSKPSPRKENTKAASQSQGRWLSFYDGSRRLATIEGNVGAFAVITASGSLLGHFDTIKQATAAISAAAGGAR